MQYRFKIQFPLHNVACTTLVHAGKSDNSVISAPQRMMIERQVRVTPTFLLFRNSEVVHTVSGINETNLRAAIEEH